MGKPQGGGSNKAEVREREKRLKKRERRRGQKWKRRGEGDVNT